MWMESLQIFECEYKKQCSLCYYYLLIYLCLPYNTLPLIYLWQLINTTIFCISYYRRIGIDFACSAFQSPKQRRVFSTARATKHLRRHQMLYIAML